MSTQRQEWENNLIEKISSHYGGQISQTHTNELKTELYSHWKLSTTEAQYDIKNALSRFIGIGMGISMSLIPYLPPDFSPATAIFSRALFIGFSFLITDLVLQKLLPEWIVVDLKRLEDAHLNGMFAQAPTIVEFIALLKSINTNINQSVNTMQNVTGLTTLGLFAASAVESTLMAGKVGDNIKNVAHQGMYPASVLVAAVSGKVPIVRSDWQNDFPKDEKSNPRADGQNNNNNVLSESSSNNLVNDGKLENEAELEDQDNNNSSNNFRRG